MSEVEELFAKHAADRQRRQSGADLCDRAGNALYAIETDIPEPIIGAILDLLRETATLGRLDPEFLARRPAPKVLDLAERIVEEML